MRAPLQVATSPHCFSDWPRFCVISVVNRNYDHGRFRLAEGVRLYIARLNLLSLCQLFSPLDPLPRILHTRKTPNFSQVGQTTPPKNHFFFLFFFVHSPFPPGGTFASDPLLTWLPFQPYAYATLYTGCLQLLTKYGNNTPPPPLGNTLSCASFPASSHLLLTSSA